VVNIADGRTRGLLVVNADDWGLDSATSRMILDCIGAGSVSAVSAMVFMEDSQRAAATAIERGIDAGLHLNLTTPFTEPRCGSTLLQRQAPLARYLRSHRLASVMFHPGLRGDFEYVVRAQLDEYRRLYGRDPDRIDGHHHMHLCANVVGQRLLPRGTLVRRNFSFGKTEKSPANRWYRRALDGVLGRRHRLNDYLFSIRPMESARLTRICALATSGVVELETHPADPVEYRFLMDERIREIAAGVRVGPFSALPANASGATGGRGERLRQSYQD
jgi:hypothetical protein